MTTTTIAHPPIACQAEWLAARKALLTEEKELTKHHDRVSAKRRRLPMVKLEKDYVFDGPEGKRSLLDLFEGRQQLIIYHFMFDPEWDAGCSGCTGFVNALGNISLLNDRNTTFALISRAPLPKLQAYKAKMGWDESWYSSFGSDFNYDFHVTHDPSIAPVEYNFKPLVAHEESSEAHGLSVFFRLDDQVFHTYSAYARGVENLTNTMELLEVTPYGRQEDWEDSPSGWPQQPTYG